jgi:hypothetical protein
MSPFIPLEKSSNNFPLRPAYPRTDSPLHSINVTLCRVHTLLQPLHVLTQKPPQPKPQSPIPLVEEASYYKLQGFPGQFLMKWCVSVDAIFP